MNLKSNQDYFHVSNSKYLLFLPKYKYNDQHTAMNIWDTCMKMILTYSRIKYKNIYFCLKMLHGFNPDCDIAECLL